MEKCLTTYLKETFDNNNLPYLDYVAIDIDSENAGGFSVHYDSPVVAKATGTIQFVDANGDPLDPAQEINLYNNNVRISAGKGKLLLPKYYMNTFNMAWNGTPIDMAFNLEDVIRYNTQNLERIKLEMTGVNPNIVGDLSKGSITAGEINLMGCTGLKGNVLTLASGTTTVVEVRKTNLGFPTSNIVGKNSIVYLGLNENVIGNIAELGKLPVLGEVRYGSAGSLKSPIYGNFTNFVTNAVTARQAAGGDGSGSVTFYYPAVNFPLVTWPSQITAETRTATISWDANGVISVVTT